MGKSFVHDETSSAVETELGRVKPRRKRERRRMVRWKRSDSVRQRRTMGGLACVVCAELLVGLERGGGGMQYGRTCIGLQLAAL